ncbi:MAG: MFS transporter [Acetobacteraceae bacterium]
MGILTMLGHWYKSNGHAPPPARKPATGHATLSGRQVGRAVAVLMALIFSKYFYLASITSYYTFYLMHHFHLPTQTAQIYLFVFLAAAAAGTVIGGPVGDRFGRKAVIWGSIVGILPFTLVLPYVGLAATIGLSVVIGLVLSPAFSAIVGLCAGTDAGPGRHGLGAVLRAGLRHGRRRRGRAGRAGRLDQHRVRLPVCSFLPLIGLLTAFLPDVEGGCRARPHPALAATFAAGFLDRSWGRAAFALG